MVEKFFDNRGIAYDKIDLSDSSDLWQDLFNKTGTNRVPYIQYGKKIVTGYNRPELMRLVEGL